MTHHNTHTPINELSSNMQATYAFIAQIRIKCLVVSLFILSSLIGKPLGAQHLNDGFSFLEKGQFQDAKQFFAKAMKDYPEHKTVRLCYGRALGLSGDASSALSIFEQLSNEFPSDLEVMLNQAEAWLWIKQPENAIPVYEDILELDSGSFVAWMGKANSHAMQQDYESAYNTIVKAQGIQPSNAQVLQSKKFIILGLANQKANQKGQYEEALDLIERNLRVNPLDQDTWPLKANVLLMSKKYDAAIEAYEKLENHLSKLMGVSTIKHLQGEDEEAFQLSIEALAFAKQNEQSRLGAAQKHYFNALLWTKKFDQAKLYVDSLESSAGAGGWYEVARANWYIHRADLIKGSESYEKALATDSASFEGNLGYANVMNALGLGQVAYQYANETLKYFPGQSDAKGLITALHNKHSLKTKIGYVLSSSSDGSKNRRWYAQNSFFLDPVTEVNTSYGRAEYKNINNDNTPSSTTQDLGLTIARQQNKWMMVSAGLGLFQTRSGLNEKKSFVNAKVETKLFVSRSQKLNVGYYSEVQNFNQALLDQRLQSHHLVVKSNHYRSFSGLGWYSEYYRSFYNDGNKRSLLFTSVYRQFKKLSFLKSGFNFINLAFKESKPLAYFSPTGYNQVEAFTGLSFNSKSKKTSFMLDGALGRQWNNGLGQNTWRAKASFKQKIGRAEIGIVAEKSTISAATGNGFSFQSYDFSIRLPLTKRPLFIKR